MRSGYELFRIGGVPLKLHTSFTLLMIIMALLAVAGGGRPSEVGLRLLAPLILVATVVLHEVGHAVMAMRLGVRVMDIVLTPLGGMARLDDALREPRKELAIAAAGPLTNLALAGILLIVTRLTTSTDLDWSKLLLLDADEGALIEGDPLMVALSFNLLLGILNLTPAFPTDGGRILRAVLSIRLKPLIATRIATRAGTWCGIVLIILPFVLDSSQWWITPLIGLFLIFSCVKERIAVEAREGLLRSGLRFEGRRSPDADPPSSQPPSDSGSSSSSPAIIDVTGTSRVIEDDREDPES